jgi:hypothetical protein
MKIKTVHVPIHTHKWGSGKLLHILSITSDWKDSDFDAAAERWPNGIVSTSRVSMGLRYLKNESRRGLFSRKWI